MQTTFKSNLEGYTTQISTEKNTEEYRKLEAQAAKAAQEIEGSGTNKLAIELENGDEEEAFSAVVRGKGGMYFHGIFGRMDRGRYYMYSEILKKKIHEIDYLISRVFLALINPNFFY